MNGFVLQNNKNIWYGSFAAFDELGFGNAFSCRLHGESALISGGLNLALHVGDEAGLVLKTGVPMPRRSALMPVNLPAANRYTAAMLPLLMKPWQAKEPKHTVMP